MVITMRTMGEVQMAGDQIIDVVSVRHGLMPAVRAMVMSGLMPLAAMGRRASSRVLRGNAQPMFIDMVVVWMVQMSIMQVVDVAVMGDGRMPAVGSVLMGVLFVDGVVVHQRTPSVNRTGVDCFPEV